MYTQVSFGQFLEKLLAQAKAEHGIEFDEYPNLALRSLDGDWLYQIENNFSVRVFRWPPHKKLEEKVAGPDWDNLQETREEFEARFAKDFTHVIIRLSSASFEQI